MSILCPVCTGSGSLITFTQGREWWTCPCCGGAGVRVLYGPPTIKAHNLKIRKVKR